MAVDAAIDIRVRAIFRPHLSGSLRRWCLVLRERHPWYAGRSLYCDDIRIGAGDAHDRSYSDC
jgi:hypothetical protein